MKTRPKRPHNKLLLSTIGEAFRSRREELGYTLQNVADMTGMCKMQVHAIEHARVDIRLTNFNKLLKALELKVGNIL